MCIDVDPIHPLNTRRWQTCNQLLDWRLSVRTKHTTDVSLGLQSVYRTNVIIRLLHCAIAKAILLYLRWRTGKRRYERSMYSLRRYITLVETIHATFPPALTRRTSMEQSRLRQRSYIVDINGESTTSTRRQKFVAPAL